MMKPILFNTEMVRAILDGRKTVTRQVVNYKHLRGLENLTAKKIQRACVNPYRPGDILYVRETWAQVNESIGMGLKKKKYIYRANYSDAEAKGQKWRPSIHMPREAARIWLRVTDMRVERLQDIGWKDFAKEGIKNPCVGCKATFGCDNCINDGYTEVDEFADLWDSTINPAGRDRYGWAANPWVWVIEFERCEKPKP